MPPSIQNLVEVYKKSHDEKIKRRKPPEKKEAPLKK